MDFRIANTFTDSLAVLTGNKQKALKATVFDLQSHQREVLPLEVRPKIGDPQ